MDQKLSLVILFVSIIISPIAVIIKKKNVEIFYESPMIWQIPISGIVCSILIFPAIKILFNVGIGMFGFMYGIWLMVLMYSIYKAFRDKELVMNEIDSEIFEQAVIASFKKHGYNLEEVEDEDVDQYKRKFIIKDISSYLLLAQDKKGKIRSMNIVKYKKIENLIGIIDEMQCLLRKEEKINKKFSVGIMELVLPIILMGSWIYFYEHAILK